MDEVAPARTTDALSARSGVSREPHFAYATNAADGTLSIYTVDASTGQLRDRGYALTGTAPRSVAVDPAERFVFVTNETSDDVSVYAIDPATGQLAPVPGSPFAAGDAPFAATVHPSGRFVYVVNDGSNDVSGYRVSRATGALTPIPGSPFPAGRKPRAVLVAPDGRFAFVLDDDATPADPEAAGHVGVYAVEPVRGALVPVLRVKVGVSPRSMALTPSGRFLFVANAGANQGSSVSAFAVDPFTGHLAPVPGSPFAAPAGAAAIAIAPSGMFVYVASPESEAVATFRVAASGALAELASTPTGNAPAALALDPTGAFLYAVDPLSDDVSIFAIAGGAPVPVSTVRARAMPTDLVVSAGRGSVAFEPLALYAAGGPQGNPSGPVTSYPITGTGTLGAATVMPSHATGGIATDPYGRFCYATGAGVAAFTVAASTGALTPVAGSPFSAGATPAAVAVEPSGRFAYVANRGDGTVSAFAIDQTTGAPSAIAGSPFAVGASPFSIAIDPTGRFAYVPSLSPPSVAALAIDPPTGALSPLAGSPFPAGAPFSTIPLSTQWGAAIDPSGRFAYFVSTAGVLAYAVGTDGALGAIAGSPFPLAGGDAEGLAVTVDPTGRYVYAADFDHAAGNYAVWGFTLDPATGALAALPGSPFTAGSNEVDIAEGLAIDPSGRFLYLGTGFDGTIVAFAIATTTGALTLLPGAPFADPGGNVYGVAISGALRFD